RVAFTTRSEGWKQEITKRAREMTGNRQRGPVDDEAKEAARKLLEEERETERLGLLAWVTTHGPKGDYEADKFCLPDELPARPITPEFVVEENGKKHLKLKSLIDARCASCHSEGGANAQATKYPLDDYAKLQKYLTVKEGATRMSLEKLAQTTHVHLL